MPRSQMREHIFKLLFVMDFNPADQTDRQESLYFEQVPDDEIDNPPLFATDEEISYIKDKTNHILKKIPEIDEKINAAAHGWSTGRMARTDLAVLRLAVFEMQYDADIPTGVAINEAVELAKKYGSSASPAFINGILGKLA